MSDTLSEQYDEKPVLDMAARRLAESTRRSGGLGAPPYGGISGRNGLAAHKAYSARAPHLFPHADLYFEYNLNETVPLPDHPFDLHITGRCDLIAYTDDVVTVVEIKSFRGDPSHLPKEGDPTHRAQAILYAHMLWMTGCVEGRRLPNAIHIELHYISIDTGEIVTIPLKLDKEHLRQAFETICRHFITRRGILLSDRQQRRKMNQTALFPYEQIRDGQETMMREVTAAIRDRSVLFVQAPTGIGKTVATVYPALKAQAHGMTGPIFYLTPTRAQRQIAEQALDDLRQSHFAIRSITIRAKQTACIAPAHFCDKSSCPYASGYYERLDNALADLAAYDALSPSIIREVAIRHRLCPFELSLDVMLYTDVIICDYNYIFDPRIRWKEYLDDPKSSYTLLVDEAHNLAERSRSMFSAVLSGEQMKELYHLLISATVPANDALNTDVHAHNPPSSQVRDPFFRSALRAIEIFFEEFQRFSDFLSLDHEAQMNDPFMGSLERRGTFLGKHFLGLRHLPKTLLSTIERMNQTLRQLFDCRRDFEKREHCLRLSYDLFFLQKISEDFYDDTYITAFRLLPSGELAMSLLTLDASHHLTETYREKSPVIFFSATLEPKIYFMSLLNASYREDRPIFLNLKSPFDKERRLVLVDHSLSMRFRDRPQTLPIIAQRLLDMTSLRRGNYLVFCPSFAYLRQMCHMICHLSRPETLDIIRQPPGMTEAQKNDFLSRFTKKNSCRSLLGFAVMGSLFNEGVDLRGEALHGVIILGTGLPGLSPEREILRQYYDEKTSRGFEYAFTWPGFNRVMQAAGRLIRTETDYGIVLLIDDRYNRREYRQLFPPEWGVEYSDNFDASLARMKDFWRGYPDK